MISKSTKRHCCYIDPATNKGCGQEAQWQIFPKSGNPYEYLEACSDHAKDMKLDTDDILKIEKGTV